MTLVNHETGELIAYADVRKSIDRAKASLEEAAEQIVWQIENQVWTVLGYATWNEMREAEYGGAAFMVPRAERPELVARMKRQGLTNVEIAETAGVAEATVRNDLNRNSAIDTPSVITNSRGQQRPTSYTRSDRPAPTAASPVEAAVDEFPDLAHYVSTGDPNRAVGIASDLRRFRDRGELPERLDTLRRSIALDKAKRDGTHVPAQVPIATERTCPTCNGSGTVKEVTS